MFSDGVMRLVERGTINGKRKTLLPGKIVTSFVMGTSKLYEWVDENPAIEMRPTSFTNDPFIIARNDRMMAINAALGVDLTGQVASDTLLGRFFSGIGGQVDFVRGAARSRGGKPIIALRSTAKSGKVSRICAVFEEGAGVVTSRGDVHYVVTEYGIADLWGKTIRQRAMALIEIAHPDARGDLLLTAKNRHYVFPDQVAPRGAYPWNEERAANLPSGESILVRPVRVSDEGALQDLFYRLSDESTYRRFMMHHRAHPHEEMQALAALDYESAMGVIACRADGGREEILGMARYDLDPATRLAEIAFVVRDDWQHRGVGRVLFQRMADVARTRDIAGFTAHVLLGNRPMMSIFEKSGLPLEVTLSDGAYHLIARFEPHPAPPKDGPSFSPH
jgi:GNAT superfamily N-acetyltransferase